MLVNPSNIVAKAKATIQECTVRDARESIDENTILIDIREPAEYQKGHLPDALHMPRGLLEFEIHALVERERPDTVRPADEQKILLYCGTGGRSALAAQSLNALGYKDVTSMDGGIVAWAAAGFPIES